MRVSASIRSGINLNMSDISTEAFSSEVKPVRVKKTRRDKNGVLLRFDRTEKTPDSPQLPQAIGNDRMTAPDGIPSPSRALIARLTLPGFVEEALC